MPSTGSLLERKLQIQDAKLSIERQKWIIEILKLNYKFYKHRFITLSCYNCDSNVMYKLATIYVAYAVCVQTCVLIFVIRRGLVQEKGVKCIVSFRVAY